MRSMVTCACVAAITFLALGCATGAPRAAWKPLLNGRNLEGWRHARQPLAESTWYAETGAITNVLHGNDVATIETFKDFDLALEYKIVKGGNSGVYLRGRVEIQVLDSFGKQTPGKGDDGAIYDQFPPRANASKPAGEWNTLEVRYQGNEVTARLNGMLIHDHQPVVKPTGGALPGGVDEAGPIMLQGDHGKVWYRNIRIRPIP